MDQPEALAWAVAEFARKPNDTYHLYHRYLSGDQPLAFATEKFKEAFGTVFKEFAYNLCETVVDAHTDRMEITGFGSDDDDAMREARRKAIEAGQEIEASEQSLAQRAQDIWDANNMDERAGQVHADMFAYGDAYVIVDVIDNQPVIWPGKPTEMRIAYSDQRPGQRIAAARLWGEGTLWRLNVWTETELAKYQARRTKDAKDYPQKASEWEPYSEQPEPIPNPIPGIVPVFHFGNNARVNDYGVSELRSVIPLQDGVNKTVTDMMVAMEFYAFRQRVLLGVSLDPNDEQAKQMLENFQTGLTRMIYLDGADGKLPSIEEFSETNIKQYIDVIERYEKKVAIITKVPRNYFGQRNADAISGESKRMDDTPFTKKIEKREKAAGSVWSEVQTYALQVTGAPAQPGDLRVNWAPADPMSDIEEWTLAGMKKGNGMPFEQMLKEMGYEPEQIAAIQQLKQREAEEAIERNRRQFDMGNGPDGRPSDAFAVNGSQN